MRPSQLQPEVLLEALTFLTAGDLDVMELVSRKYSSLIASHIDTTLPRRCIELEYDVARVKKPLGNAEEAFMLVPQPERGSRVRVGPMKFSTEYHYWHRYDTLKANLETEQEPLLAMLREDRKLAGIRDLRFESMPSASDLAFLHLVAELMKKPLEYGHLYTPEEDASQAIQVLVEDFHLTKRLTGEVGSEVIGGCLALCQLTRVNLDMDLSTLDVQPLLNLLLGTTGTRRFQLTDRFHGGCRQLADFQLFLQRLLQPFCTGFESLDSVQCSLDSQFMLIFRFGNFDEEAEERQRALRWSEIFHRHTHVPGTVKMAFPKREGFYDDRCDSLEGECEWTHFRFTAADSEEAREKAMDLFINMELDDEGDSYVPIFYFKFAC